MRLCTAVEWYPSARCLAAPARTAPQRTAVAPATGAVSRPALPRQRSRRPLWHQAASLAARQPAAPSSDAHAISHMACCCVCFFVLCNRHWFNKAPGPDPRGTELEVAYLPFTISSDAGYADLPLPLLGAPSRLW
jgi:hypothetical protein